MKANGESATAKRPFRHRLRVRYGECDPQGVVFNVHYFSYFDVAMTEFHREVIGPYSEMLEGGADMVVAEARARYTDPGAKQKRSMPEAIRACLARRLASAPPTIG